jgi:protein-tyrosine phosphatase
MDYDGIFPKLWVGSHPRNPEEIDRLVREARISAILSLLTDEDLGRLGVDWPELQAQCGRRRVELRRLPVIDGDTADLRERLVDCVCVLDGLLAAGRTVYLHCAAGIERSPSVAIAYLRWCMGYDLDEAAAYVNSCRGCSPDIETIELATRDLLRGDLVRQRIERKAIELSGGAESAAWGEARKHVLRQLIMEHKLSQ